ncbi:hypothetical protein HUJ04_007322 [Dendroctonus ponderosae]|nr:hypothetical protein HUJ04_007322 [Dendroctonus ponderosae]
MQIISTLWVCVAYAKPQYNYPVPAPTFGSNNGGFVSGGSGVFGGSSAVQSGQVSSIVDAGGLVGSTGGSIGVSSGGTLVQKHIYVHVAPPEPEELRPQRPIAAGQSTKHYKIIFIKAPSYEQQQQQILQAQARNEEKTLVYVLVKKPDDVADISLPTAAPTAPSKPEVYFIRYKAKSAVTGTTSGSTGGVHISGSGSVNGVSNINLSTSSNGLSFPVNTGSSVGRPSSNYGPPGQSGPY